MKQQQGMIAIFTVLIVSAVLIATVTTTTLLSIGEGQVALAGNLSEANLALVEGCAEDVLQKFHDNPAYSGTTITRPEGTCAISVIAGSPSYDVIVSAQSGNFQRRIEVKFTRGFYISLSSWQEI